MTTAAPPALAPGARRRLEAEVAAELGGDPGAGPGARWLVAEALRRAGDGGHRDPGAAHGGPSDLEAAVRAEARRMVARRRAGEPLQYVVGHWAFRHLELAVDPRVLIPRPETEQVVEAALAELRWVGGAGGPGPDSAVAVDLGTGSGAIALSLALEAPGLAVLATDVSDDALAVAAANLVAVRAGHPLAPDVTFHRGRWWEALPAGTAGTVSLAVANPPYVDAAEWDGLEPEVRREPYGALVAGPGSDGTPGLADIEAVVTGAPAVLARPASLVVELSPPQAAAAVRLARAAGFDEIRVAPDLAGRDRALVARLAAGRRR